MIIGLARRGWSATGGAESYLERLADALETVGHQPVLFAGADWPADRWPGNRERVVVPGRGPGAFADALAELAPDRCERLFSLERVWRCDCYRAGDGVHRAWLERRTAGEAAWRRWFRALNPKHRQILRLEEALFARGGAKRVVANSRLVRGEIVERYGTDPGRVAVIYNGLPEGVFGLPGGEERRAARDRLGLAQGECGVLFAGTGWERKGLGHALAALERVPEGAGVRLVVAGRGDARRALRGVSAKVRTKVTFLGPVSDMRAVYAGADVFVAPTRYDPFSNACLEAMASGLPVLTTPANGFAEVVEPGVTGEVFGTEDRAGGGQELARGVERWAERTREEGEVIRERCAAKGAEFAMGRNVAETLAVLLDEGA